MIDAERIDRVDDLARMGKPVPLSRLGINERPIDMDVKHAALVLDQFRLDPQFHLDFLRQTGGLWQVISHAAISNRDLHSPPPNKK